MKGSVDVLYFFLCAFLVPAIYFLSENGFSFLCDGWIFFSDKYSFLFKGKHFSHFLRENMFVSFEKTFGHSFLSSRWILLFGWLWLTFWVVLVILLDFLAILWRLTLLSVCAWHIVLVYNTDILSQGYIFPVCNMCFFGVYGSMYSLRVALFVSYPLATIFIFNQHITI